MTLLKPAPNPTHIRARKTFRNERINCDVCGYETDRDGAAAEVEVIRLRGLELISGAPKAQRKHDTQRLYGTQNAYAVGLPGIEETQSRSEAKPRNRRTRNAQQ